MRPQGRRPRRGFALAVAIFAIVIIGALISGAFFASNQEYRIGANTLIQQRAFSAAEYGMDSTIRGWQKAWNTGMATGAVKTLTYANSTDLTGAWSNIPTSDTVRITHLNQLTFLVVSTGVAGSGSSMQARRRTSAVLRIAIPQMQFEAALTTRGTTKLGGSSFIDGNDHNPSGWSCPPTGAALPGLTVSDTTQVQTSGCSNYSCLSGNPKLAQNPLAADTNTYFNYVNSTYNTLTASADKIYQDGSTPSGLSPSYNANGSCNTQSTTNWGDPNRATPAGACETYLPIIWIQGSAHITGGSGQGVLLVDGDLTVDGGFTFYGPVIVRGNLKTAGTGGHFNGGVMAANVDLGETTVLGNAVISYSSCAIVSVLSGTTLPKLASRRPWAEMF